MHIQGARLITTLKRHAAGAATKTCHRQAARGGNDNQNRHDHRLMAEQLFRPAVHPFNPFVLLALRHSKHLPTPSCQEKSHATAILQNRFSRSNQKLTKTLRINVHLFRNTSINERFLAKSPDTKRPTMQMHRRSIHNIIRDLGKSHAERARNVCVLRS